MTVRELLDFFDSCHLSLDAEIRLQYQDAGGYYEGSVELTTVRIEDCEDRKIIILE